MRPLSTPGRRAIDLQCLRAVVYRPYKLLALCCIRYKMFFSVFSLTSVVIIPLNFLCFLSLW